MVEAVSNGAIPYEWAVVAMTVMFVLYGIAGGLAAAILTDFIQGILTIILSFMLLPVALHAVGGMTGLRETVADPSIFTLVSPGEINGFHILMSGLIALIGIVTQPHIMGVCAAGKNEMDGRFGFAAGNLIKRFCTIPWMLVGICGIALYPNLTGNTPETSPDLVYGLVARDLLPTILPGLVGLFLAALLASIMSSCDAFMVSSAGLFTQNFYRRFFVPDAKEDHYVWVGRVTSLFIVAGGLSFAFLVEDVPSGLEWFFKIQALMGAAFWLGLFWRRTSVAGVWAGTLAAFAVMLFAGTGNVATHKLDIDGDGDTDHFTFNSDTAELIWYEDLSGEGKQFSEAQSLEGGASTDAIRLEDRDGDGDLDIILLGEEGRWWENVIGQFDAEAEEQLVEVEPLTGDSAIPEPIQLAGGDEWIAHGQGEARKASRGKIQPFFATSLPDFMIWDAQFRFSWSVFFYLSTGFLIAILVSLFTPRVPAHKLEKFYAALRTPIQPNEPHQRPFDLPPGVEAPPPNKLINHPDLEIPMPTKEGMAGFLIFWAWVAALIALVYWIAGIGA